MNEHGLGPRLSHPLALRVAVPYRQMLKHLGNGRSTLIKGFEFTWACGPPIDMKIGLNLCGMLMGVDGTGLITLWIK